MSRYIYLFAFFFFCLTPDYKFREAGSQIYLFTMNIPGLTQCLAYNNSK